MLIDPYLNIYLRQAERLDHELQLRLASKSHPRGLVRTDVRRHRRRRRHG